MTRTVPEHNRLLDPDGDGFAHGSSSSKSFGSSIPLLSSFSPRNRKIVVALLALSVLALFYFRRSILQMCPYHPPSASPVSLLEPQRYPRHILITGGAGYIGSHMSLLLYLQDEPYDVVVVDDLSRGDMRNIRTLQALQRKGWSYTFYKHDCGDTQFVAEKLKEHAVELVIHFAGFAYASESVQYPLRYFDNIVTKTQGLLGAMESAKVPRLLYSSSSATYGQPLDEACDVPIHENSPQVPVSPYGQSKLMAEQVIAAYQVSQLKAGNEFSYAALRYFNVIGADKDGRVGPLPKPELKPFSRVVDACFDAVTSGEAMNIYGNDYSTPDGTAIRDYIHVWDLVRAHLAVIAAVHSNSAIPYNVGIGHGFSNKQLAEACGKAVGEEVQVVYKERREGDPALVLGDASKIQRELGWRAEYVDLAEAIGTAWRWRQKSDELAKSEGK